MAITITNLTADTWTKVLTNVKFEGQVFIQDVDVEPTAYLMTFVNTGEAAPDDDYAGGIPFEESFSPAHEPESPVTGSDYYVMAKGKAGRVIIIT
jgi:hypothetical protein